MFDLTLARPADVAPLNGGNCNAVAGSADDHERSAILLVACVAWLGVMSAAFLVFVYDETAAWFDASSEPAIAAQLCDATTDSGRGLECQRDVAQAATQLASSPRVLAWH